MPRKRIPGTCSVEGCERSLKCKGLCEAHHQRQIKGKPLDMPLVIRRRKPPAIRREGDIAYVELTQGKIAVIDAADIPLVSGVTWTCIGGYARRCVKLDSVAMHNVIMPPSEGCEIDHRDGDKLNNRRSNLREATDAQNSQNRGVPRTNTTGCKGVTKREGGRKWAAGFVCNGKYVHVGYFSTKEEAAAAYEKKARELFGEFFRETG